MKTLFVKMWNLMFGISDEASVLDHVPANRLPEDPKEKKVAFNNASRKLAKAREEAKKVHGRTFKCDTLVPRETQPSLALKEIMKQSPQSATDVVATRRIARQ